MALRSVLSVGFVALFAIVGAGDANADSVRIVEGGPRIKSKRAAVERSLQGVATSLSVCWRGKRPDAVTVELTVDAKGNVTAARQRTRGAVAQCAAGVLAVQTLAATGSRYRLRAAFATRSGHGDAIQAALSPYRAKLESCRDRAGARSRAGRITVKFLIHPNGRITKPEVLSSAVVSSKAERCLTDRLAKLRLPAGLVHKTVSYSLALSFAGGSKSTAATGRATGAPSLQPKKDGPLSGRTISAVMNRRKADFSKCYKAQARKNRSLAGQVVLRFTIRDDGAAHNVKIRETTLNNTKVERCIVRVGKSLRFPAKPDRGPTKVWYPFAFSTANR